MTKTISVVLVDDNVVAREAVAKLIKQHPGFDASAAAANVADTVSKVREANAGAVLLDARHNHDSVRLAVDLRQVQPDTRIIVTGIRPHQRDITDFIAAGASGFIMKDASLEECLESIRVVTDGGHALPRRLVGSLFEEIAEKEGRRIQPSSLQSSALTKRERQVLALIGDGLANKEIAARLHIAGDTVRSHVASLFKKLGLRTRLQVAAFARADEEHHALDSRSPHRKSPSF